MFTRVFIQNFESIVDHAAPDLNAVFSQIRKSIFQAHSSLLPSTGPSLALPLPVRFQILTENLCETFSEDCGNIIYSKDLTAPYFQKEHKILFGIYSIFQV